MTDTDHNEDDKGCLFGRYLSGCRGQTQGDSMMPAVGFSARGRIRREAGESLPAD
jgi:hypothetical protein